MARALKRRSALEAVYSVGRLGAERDAIGVTLRERRDLSLVHIEISDDDTETIESMSSIFDTPLPSSTRAVATNDKRCIWLAPTRWLFVTSEEKSSWDLDQLASDARDVAINDVASSRTVMRVAGPNARDVLASDCTIDLGPDQFPIDMAVTTDLDHVTVILDCVDIDVFDLYVPRGFAVSIWEWLNDVSAEFGGEVLAP